MTKVVSSGGAWLTDVVKKVTPLNLRLCSVLAKHARYTLEVKYNSRRYVNLL